MIKTKKNIKINAPKSTTTKINVETLMAVAGALYFYTRNYNLANSSTSNLWHHIRP